MTEDTQEQEKRLAELRDENLSTKLRTEVEQYTLPGLSVDEAVALLKGVSTEQSVMVRKMFRGTTELVSAHQKVLKTVGVVGAMTFDDDSATAKIEKEATELVKAGKAPTIQQAKASIYTSNPELAQAMRAELAAARN